MAIEVTLMQPALNTLENKNVFKEHTRYATVHVYVRIMQLKRLKMDNFQRSIAGAFLLPYVIMMTIVGLPVFFLELIVGQYSAAGPLNIWSISPLFRGKQNNRAGCNINSFIHMQQRRHHIAARGLQLCSF